MCSIVLVPGAPQSDSTFVSIKDDRDPHWQTTNHVSLHKVVAILLPIFLVLTYLLCNWRSVPLTPLHLFGPLPTPLPSGNHLFVLCI